MTFGDWIKITPYIVDIIKAIAWPITVFLIVKKFENEVKALIDHIKISFSFGDKKVDITHEKEEELKQEQESNPEQTRVKDLESENKKHSDIEKNLLELLDNTAKTKDALFLGYHFEKTYRLIFGSQLSILNLAYQHGKITNALAEAIYRRTMWIKTYPFESYIGFLINSGLINQLDPTDQSHDILPVGKAFVEYLNTNNMPLNKQPY